MRVLLLTFTFLFLTVTTLYSKGIVVNEIMANPKGSQLPAFEYIELFNNGSTVQELAEITLIVNNKNISLPSYLLAPKQWVVLCSIDAEVLLGSYGNVIALTNWSTLSNSGAIISLQQQGQIIDEVAYKDSWHQTSIKKSGGWSLERINPNWTCNIPSNWSSTIATRGGTPGAPNSIYNSTYLPSIEITSGELHENRIHISFNTPITYLPAFTKEQFRLEETGEAPTAISWNEQQDTLILSFAASLKTDILYSLTIAEVEICGTKISIAPYLLFQQQTMLYHSVVINEILFNPKKGGSDFVELYNTTAYPINLQGWKLGNRIISDELLLLAAGDFMVLTAEKNNLIAVCPNAIPDRIHQMNSLPSYPNQQGVVTLFSPSEPIDSLYYNANMHSTWIDNPQGISLERVSYTIDTNEPDNFKSAAILVGGATPGYENSAIVDNFSLKNNFVLSSKTVSPDGDGFEDKLELNYQLRSSDYQLNLHIYDEKGTLIKRLIRHESASSAGKITWDCNDENQLEARPGHYIYWAEIYDNTGFREVFRGAFVLVHKSQHY